MFDAFSTRARQTVFAARFNAGERCANLIDEEDCLLGLVLEDQGMLGEILFSKLNEGQGNLHNEAPFHIPFFEQELAKNMVNRIKAVLPKMEPVGLSIKIPLSAALERVFDSTKTFRAQFPHSQMEPLHFLASILSEESSQCAKLLHEFGITLETVLKQLRGTTGDEQ
jgi:ATP-dependent Clp protease ATP-binding subunit ClpA